MRLIRHINEKENEVDIVVDLLKKNCQPFIKEFSNGLNYLIRNDQRMEGRDRDLILKRNVRKNREPTDTPPEISKPVDYLLSTKFGWYPRSEGLFCYLTEMKTTDFKSIMDLTYGGNAVFPIGKYKYVYHKAVRDLYMKLDRELRLVRSKNSTTYNSMTNLSSSKKPDKIEIIKKLVKTFEKEILPNYTDKWASIASIGRTELSLSAKSVYMVNLKILPEISQRLNLGWSKIEMAEDQY